MSISRILRMLGVACAAAQLGACGINPTVAWQPQREPDGQLDTMAIARADAASLKRALNDKAESFVGTKVALNDSLLGLGVLTLGLAAGGVHRDAFVGSSALAGTSYMFGTNNLQDATLQAYQSGIGAINCAEAAVRPLQVNAEAMADVKTQAAKLPERLTELATALSAAQNELARAVDPSKSLTTAAQAQIDAARAVYLKGANANANAGALESAVTKAAGGLKGLIAEIHATVNRMVSKAVVDPSAIPASLASLVKVVGGFGSGLGIDSFLTTRLTKANLMPPSEAAAQNRNDGGKPVVLPNEALISALNSLATVQAKVSVVADPLAAKLERYKYFDDMGALVKCNVNESISPLVIDRDTLTFVASADADQGKTLVASGGVKPYVARFLDYPTHGVEVVNPLPGDRSIAVRVPKGTSGNFELALTVTDGASPPHVRTIVVHVENATTNAQDKVGAKSGLAAVKDALQKAIDEKVSFPADGKGGTSDVNRYTIAQVEEEGGALKITLSSCQPGPANAKDGDATLQAALIDWLGGARSMNPKPAADLKSLLNLQGGASCRKV